MRNIYVLGKDKEGNGDELRIVVIMFDCICSFKEDFDWLVVVIVIFFFLDDIIFDMFLCFFYELKLEVFNESERCDMFCGLVKMVFVGNDVLFE